MDILLYPIIIPTITGLLCLLVPKNVKGVKEALVLIGATLNLLLCVFLFDKELTFLTPWGGFGFDFSLRLFHFSSFIMLAAAGFTFLIVLYSTVFMSGKKFASQFFSYMLISTAMVNGAVLADNLVVMLFFWEGLLGTLFGLIILGRKEAYKTAIKAFVIAGITDLCMMLGIALTYHISGTFAISKISIPLTLGGSFAFVLLMIGAISKAGSMPFHSWIPDAAVDAPLPFMAFLPASLEKLLGIYLLARISLDMFQFTAGSTVSMIMMIVGATTILLAVMMALIQKDFKRLLSYHAISQVGYMILGIGTALPVGIVGGLFHMINHAMYKSCLFLTGGSVEKQAGTTDLKQLGGIGRYMPVTFICFIIAAASISGVPPFNGFFSKELVYDGALERHWIFYAAALLGSFLTAASFLKLGHAAFLGPVKEENKNVKEAPWQMLIPMITIAAFCVLFGVYNYLPLNKLIQPILGARLEGHNFAGFNVNIFLVLGTLVALTLALINHLIGVKRSGSGLGASDHIHYAPVLGAIYDKAEKRCFDPYDLGLMLVAGVAKTAFFVDRSIDWIYEGFTVTTAYVSSWAVKSLRGSSYAIFIAWSLVGAATVVVILFH